MRWLPPGLAALGLHHAAHLSGKYPGMATIPHLIKLGLARRRLGHRPPCPR